MNSKIKNLLVLTTGIVCGATISWFVTKQKYETILEQEIESVKETYKNRHALVINEETTIEETVTSDIIVSGAIDSSKINMMPSKEEKAEYKSIVENNGYVNYTKYMNGGEVKENKETGEDDASNDTPYVIEPEEFGEDGYDTQTLTYYADKVLVDDLDDLVDDPDTVVGLHNLRIFEEHPDAISVLIRNEIFRVDYEIVKDDWNYSDLSQEMPHKINKEKKPHEL